MQSAEVEAIEAARQNHVGRLLHRAARAFNDEALERLHARGHEALTPAHVNLLPHLDVKGTRIVALAERAGMTKQAAGQIVAELEARGYVRRGTDPSDGRAVRVGFTEEGWRFLRDAREVRAEIEGEWRTRLGEGRWAALDDALRHLLG